MRLICSVASRHTCNEHAMVGVIHHGVNLHVSWPSLAIVEDLQY